ncbi:MAG TPA: virulence factor, partial [Acidimicrobiia bacterium]|nr:virulence factor [Acidimicrobiia bacterium]
MTPEVTVVYWRDIPVQVMSGSGRRAIRVALPERFEVAVDKAAARARLTDADSYTSEYRKVTVEGADPQVVADQLDADHPDTILEDMIRNGGNRP